MVAEPASAAAALDALHAEMADLRLEGLWRLGDVDSGQGVDLAGDDRGRREKESCRNDRSN